ncbi:hypothetical protein [Cellulomonas hominis]|uniref:hypothetical protein n=1 Tax=Cellulomonas hominis TaxID=156981 RepID=UPI001BA1731B|nr:hypothetical protein [Cellulomonas hominis]VTR76043.1 hypothetical protein CHMI_00799 [Cellulomonas hominis]
MTATNDTDDCCATPVTVSVTGPQMADWLVRSALPAMSDLAGFGERGDWFRALPPYDGHTGSGSIRGWTGALSRGLALRDDLHEAWWRGVEVVQGSGYRLRRRIALDPIEVVVGAKRELAPSTLGPIAHQVIGGASDLVLVAGQICEDPNVEDLVRGTWHRSLHTLADRALVRELASGASRWPPQP